VALAYLLASRKIAHFGQGVMVLVARDHYASNVALACFLDSHRVARFARVGVLIAFLNLSSFFCFLFVYLVSLVAALSMVFFFKLTR